MKISIVTPAGAAPRSGNQHTAERWAGFMRDCGHHVSVAQQWDGEETDMLIALHARKSSVSIKQFHRAHPDRPLIAVLTGTDLYRDIATHATARRSLEIATRLVVLQPSGLTRLSPPLHAKTRVIFQSADTRLRQSPPKDRFRVAVIGHLRREKDPFRAAMALAYLPDHDDIELIQLGAALSPAMDKAAVRRMKSDPRYHWLGSKSHLQTLRRLAASHLLVVSSVMEGGANVICEASRICVPILASHVSGNIGMLGARYPGYFSLFDERALAKLIHRSATDVNFYRSLKRAVLARRPLFAPGAERRSIKNLIREFD